MKLSRIILLMMIFPVAAFAQPNSKYYYSNYYQPYKRHYYEPYHYESYDESEDDVPLNYNEPYRQTSNNNKGAKGYIGLNGHYIRAQLNDRIAEYLIDVGPVPDIGEFVAEDYWSLSFNIGAQINQYFGMEGFFQYVFPSEANTQLYLYNTNLQVVDEVNWETEVSSMAFGLDLLGYIPIDYTKFSFIGTVGLGYYKFDGKMNISLYPDNIAISDSGDEKNIGVRIGFGGQYEISDSSALRGIVRYVALHNDKDEDVTEGMIDVSLGIKCIF